MQLRKGVYFITAALLIELFIPFLIRNLISWLQADEADWREGIALSFGIGIIGLLRQYLFRSGVFQNTMNDHRFNSVLR